MAAGWFRRLSEQQSRKNITEILAELIEATNRADASLKHDGKIPRNEARAVKRLRNQLYIELCGPLPLQQVWDELIEPALRDLDVSDGAHMAVQSIYQYAVENIKD